MRRYLLDTNAAADCIFRRRGVAERVKRARLDGAKIGIGLPVLAELLGGVEFSASRESNLAIVNLTCVCFGYGPSRNKPHAFTGSYLPSYAVRAAQRSRWT
jgi:tRNA(fMet)-specific endonuclease VapC